MKIATLLPSATEIVRSLGLEASLVGVSHSCRLPQRLEHLPRLTSTRVPVEADSASIDAFVREHLTGHSALYDLEIETLADLEPDIVVSQALCDVCAVATDDVEQAILTLACQPRLIDLTPNTLEDVFADIERVGRLLDVAGEASRLLESLQERVRRVVERSKRIPCSERPRVVFLEWLIPPFHGGHWNPELVEMAGAVNLLGRAGRPSTTTNWERISELDPEVLFVACCGFDLDRARDDLALVAESGAWQSLRAVKNERVYFADGNAFFSSPGPGLIDALELLAYTLHPDVHARPDKPEALAVPLRVLDERAISPAGSRRRAGGV
ncbi:MAG: ABC transporter substrate-binding protein [Pseudomonadota bacterium]